MGKVKKEELSELENRLSHLHITPTVGLNQLAETLQKINPDSLKPTDRSSKAAPEAFQNQKPAGVQRFHGTRFSLAAFPASLVSSPCSNRFGYLTPAGVRNGSKLPFNNPVIQALLNQLGAKMGEPGRDTGPDSAIPSGYVYFGQFIDHDITLDVSSSLSQATNATTINNMRTPAFDLDSLYMRGPVLDPFLYVFPAAGSTAIKFQLGSNTNTGVGGPVGGSGMSVRTDFDVPRMTNPLNPSLSSNTAIIGDPRNDENLIVSQFHQAMLRFHNAVVDLLVLGSFVGDIFAEAKKIVTHHYQWAIVHDFLPRICGQAAVTNALSGVSAAVGSAFSMPVEFSVAAYRFGHSMIRDSYWLSFAQTGASLGDVFNFVRNPQLPVFSNWVVDFNAFFDTGISVPVNNKARKIDSALATGLGSLPGGTGVMAMLATRNLLRGISMGLPSGQAVATHFGIAPLTNAQLVNGLPAAEVAILSLNGGILMNKTPLWYYILREAMVLNLGENLGPVGGKIVADTFIRMLKRDADSYLNVGGGFTPVLPTRHLPGEFMVDDLLLFAGAV